MRKAVRVRETDSLTRNDNSSLNVKAGWVKVLVLQVQTARVCILLSSKLGKCIIIYNGSL